MHSNILPIRRIVMILAVITLTTATPNRADACGGFFCSTVPVTQNAEQIIFRQDGDQVVALVRIQYQGPAEEFSWVVPVPGIPDVTTSSEMLFNTLELQTRPSFQLSFEGDGCPFDFSGGGANTSAPQAAPGSAEDSGTVNILDTRQVGPFDLQVVQSDDPEAMAKWLEDNNYDLNDRGRELIAPYVEAGMNFVALRLQKDKESGDLVPLKMVYKTSRPMVPIRLTAVAAELDMGVIVYLVGPARAIPTNFPHVDVNYAKLNWLGNFNPYSEYVDLVTDAMNEAGGHGFATDFAGPAAPLRDSMPVVEDLTSFLDTATIVLDPAQGLVDLFRNGRFPQTTLVALFSEHLPLPADEPIFQYGNPQRLSELFLSIQLRLALDQIVADIRTDIVEPYADSLRVFDGEPYVTRLFTTLSPDEMTLDPVFGYNSDLPDQSAVRSATFNRECILGVLNWQLILGPGTGRDGEVINQGIGEFPRTLPESITKQSAIRGMSQLAENVDPMEVATGTTPFVNQRTVCGVLTVPVLAMNLMGMYFIARRNRRLRRR